MNATGRIFLLSPAHLGGKRGALLLSGTGRSPLAERLRAGESAPLAEIYRFVSGLYFRGKLAYAERFASPPPGLPGALVLTPASGLRSVDAPIGLAELSAYAAVPIDTADPRYRVPLQDSCGALCERCAAAEVVLLGSVASGKYVDVLLEYFGPRLLFPAAFVGRGDMSRGGLMLRAAAAGEELQYVPVLGAVRRGPRPPRLEPRR